MNNYYLKIHNISKLMIYILKNPSTILPFSFLIISKISPFFNFDVKYIESKYDLKKKDIENKKNIGHARGKRLYSLKILNKRFLSKSYPEGEIATFLQFYLFRPVNDFNFLYENLLKETITCNKNSNIFEPGCGTGRHLIYINEKYDCNVYGVDSYKECINIANFIKNKKNNKIVFDNFSVLDLNKLENFLPKKIDLIYMNSYLNHIYHHENYFDFIKILSERSRYLALIMNKKYFSDLQFYLPNFSILKLHNKNSTSYILLESKSYKIIN